MTNSKVKAISPLSAFISHESKNGSTIWWSSSGLAGSADLSADNYKSELLVAWFLSAVGLCCFNSIKCHRHENSTLRSLQNHYLPHFSPGS